ncbi:protein kinase domain containing protein [Entamoeba histolytica HM-1:IMSS-B]|uniref:Protein kinase domain containing protein n=6 Tax=Entamoeba histolytica TaxID=5759 RepID=C4M9H7_ENTH1|nr:protein kinase domain containing protein [Entamoeba histolytica HM-1:IMSS]EMD44561.1 protein kinase domain containing protein [Entamoeba histolytica KU27]EMH74748.1 protein kinase domain containing protein [Entamoeba histolytica HM-1:IMSS-B]EMS16163.1 protein kinase domain containing protein [Entamoeba histolytica HM-3:IMSS]ENY63841.1 protein kinase domain containing protein [Entamoeba histolytica HM-1:IMSS-A]GAT98314.1 protein kinase domain containing protein [Entamoeba histolytica]|eukprot:XP_656639.1 protein kinase domain containing protein [Entamoeba histolytica HM-1:IMSS]
MVRRSMSFDNDSLEIDPFAPVLRGQDSILKRCWYKKRPAILKIYNTDMQSYFNEIEGLCSLVIKIKSEFIVELIGVERCKEIRILFEYCDMGTFDQFIPSCSEAFRIKILKDVIKALKIIHNVNIIAGELQPSKIFITSVDITKTSNCKLSIYGRHKRLDLKKMTLSEIQRSLVYRAPEVLTNISLSRQSDVFSFGILTYETFSKQLPYTHDDGSFSVEDMMRITQEAALTRKPKLNGIIWETITKCCKYEPSERISLDKVNEALEEQERLATNYGEACGVQREIIDTDIFKIINKYLMVLQQWTDMENFNIIYNSSVDGLNGKLISSKMMEHKNLMVIIQTKEGHVFGSYYGGFINRIRDISFNVEDDSQKYHFAFSLINPHKTAPINVKKRKEYRVAFRFNGQTNEVISVPSFFFIFSDATSYISTSFNVAYEHVSEYGFDLFCEGQDYSSPYRVGFNLMTLYVIEWTPKR